MAQLPCSLVRVSRLTAVSSETTITAALGTAAPCTSVTRPPNVARTSCASARFSTALPKAAEINTTLNTRLNILSIPLLEGYDTSAQFHMEGEKRARGKYFGPCNERHARKGPIR